MEQVEEFKQHYKNEIARVRDKEKAVSKEERIAKRILAELMKPDTGKALEETREKEENRKVEKSRQLVGLYFFTHWKEEADAGKGKSKQH